MENFIKNLADQFDETDLSEFTGSTTFRDLEEWSSLIGLAVLNMIDKKYNVKFTPKELRGATSIEELYNLVKSKK